MPLYLLYMVKHKMLLDKQRPVVRRSFLLWTPEVGDDGAAGPSWLGYYKHKTASHSLCTSARQRCACVFL